MANEVATLWVLISGVIGLVAGALIVFVSFRTGALQKGKVVELENQLSAAQDELSDYKQQVFSQFADTAEKFRTLDESYHALHRQLAESSVALCGDQATPLLPSATMPQEAIADVQEVGDTPPAAEAQDTQPMVADDTASQKIPGGDEELAADGERVTDGPEQQNSADVVAEVPEPDNIVIAEPEAEATDAGGAETVAEAGEQTSAPQNTSQSSSDTAAEDTKAEGIKAEDNKKDVSAG